MKAPSKERMQFLWDVFVTACDGGIGYWAKLKSYHAFNADDSADLVWFRAVVREYDDEGNVRPDRLVIDQQVVMRGINRLLYSVVQVNDYLMATLARASRDNDAGDVDADLADIIVQAGLFGEVRYA